MVIDASVILSALFPDEAQQQAQSVLRDHALAQISLSAPTLFGYEITNAVWQGVRRQRITQAEAEEILKTVDNLVIVQKAVKWQDIFPFAVKFGRSAYDASYIALANIQKESLVTGDLRLYNAVHDELPWVQWVGDYEAIMPE
jgi:predicted nucleic acid-binding protein